MLIWYGLPWPPLASVILCHSSYPPGFLSFPCLLLVPLFTLFFFSFYPHLLRVHTYLSLLSSLAFFSEQIHCHLDDSQKQWKWSYSCLHRYLLHCDHFKLRVSDTKLIILSSNIWFIPIFLFLPAVSSLFSFGAWNIWGISNCSCHVDSILDMSLSMVSLVLLRRNADIFTSIN